MSSKSFMTRHPVAARLGDGLEGAADALAVLEEGLRSLCESLYWLYTTASTRLRKTITDRLMKTRKKRQARYLIKVGSIWSG